jgi:hypothetical protein
MNYSSAVTTRWLYAYSISKVYGMYVQDLEYTACPETPIHSLVPGLTQCHTERHRNAVNGVTTLFDWIYQSIVILMSSRYQQ